MRCMSEKWVGAITQHKLAGECKRLRGLGTTEVCSEADSILSPSEILEFMLLINLLFKQKEKNIIGGHNEIRTTSKNETV